MAKDKKYLAIVTKNGIPEALYLDFLEKNPQYKKDWMSRALKTMGLCSFEEVTEEEAQKGTEKYFAFYEKQRENERKEFEKQREEKLKSMKLESDSNDILKPAPLPVEEKELPEKKSIRKNIVKRKK